MKTLTLLFILLFTSFCLNAQTLEWAKKFNGTGIDMGISIAIDASDNVYTTGSFEGTVDFDPGIGTFYLTSTGGSDVFISKLDALGNFIWAKSVGGTNSDLGWSIATDAANNIYTIGNFSLTADFDPGIGIYNLTSFGSNDIFILKLDTSGNFVWAKRFGGTTDDICFAIAIDNFNNIYTTGRFTGTADFDPGSGTFNLISAGIYDIFISKLDVSGNFVWAKSIKGSGMDSGESIALDSNGNIYTIGMYSGTADFDPGIGTFNLTSSSGISDICIFKLDAAGNFIWAKSMGGIGNEYGLSISLDYSCNVYTTGYFEGTADFDPGTGIHNLTSIGNYDTFISKLDSLGNFIWVKQIGGLDNVQGYSIALDASNKIYTSGIYMGTADFDTGVDLYNLTSAGSWDIFISILDTSGNFVYAESIGGIYDEYARAIALNDYSNIYFTGYFRNLSDFDPGSGVFYLSTTNTNWDIFSLKLRQKGVSSKIYNDLNQNCFTDSIEIGLQNRLVRINPGNLIVQTNELGIWSADSIPIGTYTATIDTSGNWQTTCPNPQIFIVTNSNEITFVPSFGLVSTFPCASPEVSINMPQIRPCINNQVVYVSACNLNIATGVLINAYVEVVLDSLITLNSASIAYTSLGNNVYHFELGDLNPGQCTNFTINCDVSCNSVLGQTLCLQANLYPADSCVFDTIPTPYPGNFTPCTLPWDKSSLEVEGYCQNDSVYFVVTNTGQFGNGDMDCFSPVRIYIDGVYYLLDSIQLVGGDTAIFVFPGDGRTWRLEADQHPLHPGNSHPNATVEACGDISNWTSDLINIFPPDDADPIVDIYCGVVTGSYDPNDKTGYPTGVTTEHYIMPNQQLQYVIRFQNTGTDTAFTVVVRDTLDTNLDIFSVVPGVASHNYNFQMYGPRVLEWTFYNILLPDSNHNQIQSHGFATFTVNQNANLSDNAIIYNSADIYFDYNAPVITNQTMHTINDGIQTILSVNSTSNDKTNSINVYPNPTTSELNIAIKKNLIGKEYSISDMIGRTLINGKFSKEISTISLENLANGIYLLRVNGENTNSFKVIKN